jgi:hypothetical protein
MPNALRGIEGLLGLNEKGPRWTPHLTIGGDLVVFVSNQGSANNLTVISYCAKKPD